MQLHLVGYNLYRPHVWFHTIYIRQGVICIVVSRGLRPHRTRIKITLCRIKPTHNIPSKNSEFKYDLMNVEVGILRLSKDIWWGKSDDNAIAKELCRIQR